MSIGLAMGRTKPRRRDVHFIYHDIELIYTMPSNHLPLGTADIRITTIACASSTTLKETKIVAYMIGCLEAICTQGHAYTQSTSTTSICDIASVPDFATHNRDAYQRVITGKHLRLEHAKSPYSTPYPQRC